MKILIDPYIFNIQKFGGISRYYAEMYVSFNKTKGIKAICPLYYSENLHLKEYAYLISILSKLLAPIIKSRFGNRVRDFFYLNSYKKRNDLLKKNQVDLFVPTYYNVDFLPYINEQPFVLTVYDMIHELFPQYFKNDKTTVPNKKILIEQATKIIAISESTKKDILKIYPHIDSTKIEVVYLSCTIDLEYTQKLDNFPKRYILFVGNREIYKNFTFFIESVAPLLLADSDLYVVCAGGNRFSDSEIGLLNELGIAKKIIQQNFNDTELASFYTNALCFVFASEYEGFGIPVLESMTCGCPVVLANHSSFPEVAGDAGVYFELNNGKDLQIKVEKLIFDEEYRKLISEKSIEQAKKFSWKKCASETLKVYQSVVNKNNA